MTPIFLLEQLKLFAQQTVKDIILPTRMQKGNEQLEERAPLVYLMNLPEQSAETKKAPYILLQLLNGADEQQVGEQEESTCNVRIVACIYCEDEKGGAQEGALNVLNVLMRLRTRLLQVRVIGKQFTLRLPLEYLVYPDNTAPYYFGEMMTIWEFRTVKREVEDLWQETPQITDRPQVEIVTN